MKTDQRQEKLFCNLPELLPGFRDAEGVGTGWVSFDYEFDDFAGVGLATGALSPAGELVFDLKLEGWHVLHFCHSPALRVWLDDEKGYRELIDGQPYEGLRDFPMYAADMTNRKLHVAAKHGVNPREAELFYIRAVPCEGPRQSRRNLVATEDGCGVFADMESSRDLYKYFYPYRDSDFFRVLWGTNGSGDPWANSLKSKTGINRSCTENDGWSPWSDNFNNAIRNIIAAGDDPHAVAVAAARDVGMEIHFYFRIGAFFTPFPHQGCVSPFFQEHPEYHCRDEWGNEVKRLSFAFPEVQEQLLKHFDELMDYEPDGLCLAFNRGLPVMICEEPVLAEFRRRHGRDPRLPEEVDSPEMLAVRQDLLTEFVARIHEQLAKRGKVLSCVSPKNFAENLWRGLDVEALVKRGLLESVMVGSGHDDSLFRRKTGAPVVSDDDMEPVKRLKALGNAKVYLGGGSTGNFWPHGDAKTRVRRMQAIHNAGLDGGFFWDARQWFGIDWEHFRQFGDPEYVEKLLNNTLPQPRIQDTKRIGDLVVIDKYNPWNAY